MNVLLGFKNRSSEAQSIMLISYLNVIAKKQMKDLGQELLEMQVNSILEHKFSEVGMLNCYCYMH
jgi:hypothetical protein